MRKVKVYRVELLVMDFEGGDQESMLECLKNSRYYSVTPMDVQATEVDWDAFGEDQHPLNKRDGQKAEFERLFPKR